MDMKSIEFTQFWNIIQALGLEINKYLAQLLHAFNKLSKLNYVKGKPNHNVLITEAKALLIIFKYNRELSKLIFDYTFRLGVFFKKSKFFTTSHMKAELIQIVKKAIWNKRSIETSQTSLFQNLTEMFK